MKKTSEGRVRSLQNESFLDELEAQGLTHLVAAVRRGKTFAAKKKETETPRKERHMSTMKNRTPDSITKVIAQNPGRSVFALSRLIGMKRPNISLYNAVKKTAAMGGVFCVPGPKKGTSIWFAGTDAKHEEKIYVQVGGTKKNPEYSFSGGKKKPKGATDGPFLSLADAQVQLGLVDYEPEKELVEAAS